MLGKYRSLIIVLVVVITLYIPTLTYPLIGDSLSFAKITESFIEGTEVEAYYRLPALPFFSVPLALMTGSPALAIGLTALVFGIVSKIAWFFIGKEFFRETRIFPFLILCPYLIMFTVFRALNEAPFICFSLLSLFFFFKGNEDRKYFYLCGLFFGLASMSRYAGLVIGISYVLYYLLRKQKPSRELISGLIIGLILFSTIPIANTVVHGSPLGPSYMEKISGEAMGQPWFIRFFTMLPLQIICIITLTHLLIPHFVKGLTDKNNSKVLLYMLIIGLGTIFAAFSGRTWRYIVPVIPFILIVAFNGFRNLDNIWLKRLFALGILINIMLIPYFVNGQAKNIADIIYVGPIMWGEVGLSNSNALAWVNQNLPRNSTLLVGYDHLSDEPIWNEYLRDDIDVRGFVNIEDAPNLFYVFRGHESADINDYMDNSYNQTVIFQDTGLPVTSIYLIEKS